MAPGDGARAGGGAARGAARLVGGDETILVVDDNLEIREVVRRVLSLAGYQVLPSASGEDALEILHQRAGGVDLVLTDVVMPGMSGVDLAALVHVRYPAVRVLLTSGHVDEALAPRGARGGGVAFLAKPDSLKALTEKVRQVLDTPGDARAGTARRPAPAAGRRRAYGEPAVGARYSRRGLVEVLGEGEQRSFLVGPLPEVREHRLPVGLRALLEQLELAFERVDLELEGLDALHAT